MRSATSAARRVGTRARATMSGISQASQGPRVEGHPANHLGCLHWACRERRGLLSRDCLAKVRRTLVPQYLQSRALDQGAGDCGHALKAIHVSEDIAAAREKTIRVIE